MHDIDEIEREQEEKNKNVFCFFLYIILKKLNYSIVYIIIIIKAISTALFPSLPDLRYLCRNRINFLLYKSSLHFENNVLLIK